MTDDVPDGPRNVLLVGSRGSATDEACIDLLSVTDAENTNLLSVTFDWQPDELVGSYRARHGELPAKTGVIDVGGETRSAAGTAAPAGPGPSPVTIDSVSEPSDLTGLSMAISAYLDAWDDIEETPVVCFHSLSSWLSQTDDRRAFQFVQTITGRLREIGAHAHFHMDPEVHDEGTINTFSALMDAVVRVDDDGSTNVRRRRQEV